LRAFDSVWIGPEVLAMGDAKYHQLRAGAHATSFRTGLFEWSTGFGYARDSDRRGSIYGRVGLMARQ